MGTLKYVNNSDSLHSALVCNKHLDISGRLSYDKNAHPYSGGSYGDIYIGTYNHADRGSIKVAVKRIRIFYTQTPEIMKLIKQEIQIWSSLDHNNILPLLGYIFEENNFPTLVSEFMENGTVLQYVVQHPEIDAVGIILGIANGVDYLHERSIIHSDLKSDNVLISRQGTPLICDFGISRVIALTGSLSGYHVQSSSGVVRGSTRWMVPELFKPPENYSGKHTKESDVWAFGMTASELLAKHRPYHELKTDPQVIFAIVNGDRLENPKDFSAWSQNYCRAWRVCETCWLMDPASRPSLSTLIAELNNIRANKGITNDLSIATGQHILCKGCNQSIVGVRYQCAACPSPKGAAYNLCEDCEPRSYLLHDPMHIFFKLPRPVDRPIESQFPFLPILYKRPAGPRPREIFSPDQPKAYLASLLHDNTLCDYCVERISGEWFRCVYCSKDLCDACESQNVHDPTHFFYVFKAPVDMQTFRTVAEIDNPDGGLPVLKYPVYNS